MSHDQEPSGQRERMLETPIPRLIPSLAAPTITIRAAAHTIRPATMAMTRHRYREMTHCQRERAYRRPTTAP